MLIGAVRALVRLDAVCREGVDSWPSLLLCARDAEIQEQPTVHDLVWVWPIPATALWKVVDPVVLPHLTPIRPPQHVRRPQSVSPAQSAAGSWRWLSGSQHNLPPAHGGGWFNRCWQGLAAGLMYYISPSPRLPFRLLVA